MYYVIKSNHLNDSMLLVSNHTFITVHVSQILTAILLPSVRSSLLLLRARGSILDAQHVLTHLYFILPFSCDLIFNSFLNCFDVLFSLFDNLLGVYLCIFFDTVALFWEKKYIISPFSRRFSYYIRSMKPTHMWFRCTQ